MKNLLIALFKAQQEFPIIPKNKTGRSGNQQYKYSDLGDILDLVKPILHRHGLFVTQPLIAHDLVTKIIHAESGEVESYPLVISHGGDNKEFGANITYFRRYSLCAALGIVTEEDTDGADKKEDKNARSLPPNLPAALQKHAEPAMEEMPEWLREGEQAPARGLGGKICPYGKNKGQTFAQIGKPALAKDRDYWVGRSNTENISSGAQQYITDINNYLGQ